MNKNALLLRFYQVAGWMIFLLLQSACGADNAVPTDNLSFALQSLQDQLINPEDYPGRRFGHSVALSADGNTALVADDTGSDSGTSANGAAYVFVKNGASWSQQQKLIAADKSAADYFGFSVALSADGNTALIGTPYSDNSGIIDSGAAYLFVRSGNSWSQQQKLIAADKTANDEFGHSVALSAEGTTALIGAYHKSDAMTWNGAAYMFVRSGANWSQQQKLTTADRASYDLFGYSVALSADGNTALIGAREKTASGSLSNGAAYAFIKNGTSWSQQQKFLATDKAQFDHFGESVALSADGNTALIGAENADINGTNDSGAAYVFVRSGTSWSQQQKLFASDKVSSDHFGRSVALSGDGSTAVIGLNPVFTEGAAYVFVRAGSNWAERQRLAAAAQGSRVDFGYSVALSPDANIFLIGADGGPAAYVFSLLGAPCNQNIDCLRGICVDGVCCDTTCGGGIGSDCQACSVKTGAKIDGVCGPAVVGTVCRPNAGVCDVIESCDGSVLSCPGDRIASVGTVCRPSTEPNDPPEYCDGVSPTFCPADLHTGCSCSLGQSQASQAGSLALLLIASIFALRLLRSNHTTTQTLMKSLQAGSAKLARAQHKRLSSGS